MSSQPPDCARRIRRIRSATPRRVALVRPDIRPAGAPPGGTLRDDLPAPDRARSHPLPDRRHRASRSPRSSSTLRCEGIANPLETPNPAKAPWYFLGLQELLHYFPPVVAGRAAAGARRDRARRHPLCPRQPECRAAVGAQSAENGDRSRDGGGSFWWPSSSRSRAGRSCVPTLILAAAMFARAGRRERWPGAATPGEGDAARMDHDLVRRRRHGPDRDRHVLPGPRMVTRLAVGCGGVRSEGEMRCRPSKRLFAATSLLFLARACDFACQERACSPTASFSGSTAGSAHRGRRA